MDGSIKLRLHGRVVFIDLRDRYGKADYFDADITIMNLKKSKENIDGRCFICKRCY